MVVWGATVSGNIPPGTLKLICWHSALSELFCLLIGLMLLSFVFVRLACEPVRSLVRSKACRQRVEHLDHLPDSNRKKQVVYVFLSFRLCEGSSVMSPLFCGCCRAFVSVVEHMLSWFVIFLVRLHSVALVKKKEKKVKELAGICLLKLFSEV